MQLSLATFVLLTITVNSTPFITTTLINQGFEPDVCGIGEWELLHLILTALNKTIRKHALLYISKLCQYDRK
jgi:hypothetical protein